MSSLFKALILGFLTGLVGVGIAFTPIGLDLEENAGLELLFTLRGVRQPPSDVVVVAIDRESAEGLSLPDEPRKWPRSHHAHLIENLVKLGAKVIAFDLHFDEAKSTQEDDLFSEAIRKAGNIVLCEYLKREKVPLTGTERSQTGVLEIEKVVPPIPPLEKAAVALAPFPLPKVPVKVSQYWTFKTEAGDMPTLPVVVFQIFAMEAYDEFIHLLEKASSSLIGTLPYGRDAVIKSRSIENLIHEIRNIYEEDPLIAKKMLKVLETPGSLTSDFKKIQILKSLIRMYQSPHSLYLNFYGPPGTITTIPYLQVLQFQETPPTQKKELDLHGKAVFVGLSERSRPEQKDGFNTVFSQSSGLDLSGVEIAATAFANLLEDKPIQPLPIWIHFAILLLWGTVIGILCSLFPSFLAAVCVIGLGFIYFLVAGFQFKATGSWYPLVFPLFVQSPLAFFGAVVWKSMEVNRERRNIRSALGYYLPDRAIKELVKNTGDFKARRQLVYGICLYTDAERYTSLSEKMGPQELSDFMNQYYEALSKPIKEHRGIVSDIIGDSMMAIWATEKPDLASRNEACQAALDIAGAVDRFNQSSGKLILPTRIGLHSGHLLLGNVGAIDHYEYHPIGDIVNTATRIESLNKYLGTRILVSSEVIDNLDGFFVRELGTFVLVGKTRPVSIHELICRKEESNEQQRCQCTMFATVLDAFRKRSWEKAIEKSHESIRCFGEDGPCVFYLKLSERYKKNPPERLWDGVVHTTEK